MSKTALLFAGQGAQGIGMGKDWAAQFPTARALFERANAVLGYDLATLCWEGPDGELTKTEHAQPGIYLTSWVALALLKEQAPNLRFEAAAGLSLGEFTTLAAAGTFSFEDGLRVVRQRGQFMQEACELTQGGMAAIIGLGLEPTRAVCAETGVEVANLNCPDQIVISGQTAKIQAACRLAKSRGAKRALPLTVAGAYHSALMHSAQSKLHQVLAEVPMKRPAVAVISNVTAQPHDAVPEIRTRLVDQVTHPVLWEASMRFLLAQGFTRFIELGPGKVLSGFLKRIDPQAQSLNVGDAASLAQTVQVLGSDAAAVGG